MRIKGFQDTIKWYNQNATHYAQVTLNTVSLKEINQFVSLLAKGAKVLDAGCGSGRDTHLLAEKGLIVTGLDLSSGLIKVARETYPKLKFVEGNMLSLPFPNDYFDGVWSHASLLHFETVNDVQKALSEFNRVMKPQGTLYILVKAQTGTAKTAVVSDSWSKHDRFFQYFTKPEIESLLQQSGFEIINIEQYNETVKIPNGRPEVEFILALARKKSLNRYS